MANNPTVVHCCKSKQPYVYIGRPTKWGNPFVLKHERDRQTVLEKYRVYLLTMRPDLVEAAKKELRGKTLGCFCAPKACHGDVLLEVANQ